MSQYSPEHSPNNSLNNTLPIDDEITQLEAELTQDQQRLREKVFENVEEVTQRAARVLTEYAEHHGYAVNREAQQPTELEKKLQRLSDAWDKVTDVGADAAMADVVQDMAIMADELEAMLVGPAQQEGAISLRATVSQSETLSRPDEHDQEMRQLAALTEETVAALERVHTIDEDMRVLVKSFLEDLREVIDYPVTSTEALAAAIEGLQRRLQQITVNQDDPARVATMTASHRLSVLQEYLKALAH